MFISLQMFGAACVFIARGHSLTCPELGSCGVALILLVHVAERVCLFCVAQRYNINVRKDSRLGRDILRPVSQAMAGIEPFNLLAWLCALRAMLSSDSDDIISQVHADCRDTVMVVDTEWLRLANMRC